MGSDEIRIQFYGLFRSLISLSNVARQYAHALLSRFPGVALHSYSVQHPELRHHPPLRYTPQARSLGPFFDPFLSQFEGLRPDARVGVFCGIPDEAPQYLQYHPCRVGLFVCETDRIPTTWVSVSNEMTVVFVPSQFCRDAYADSGVTVPLVVMPHALEPDYVHHPGRRPATFTFFNTFHTLCSPIRKSCEELIRCFLEAFSANEDVALRLRTQDCERLREYRRRYNFRDQIHVDPLVFADTAEFARVYSEVHCTVHPSKGEGFGLIPLQSIACETPVITSRLTGMADYISPDNAVVLNMKGKVHGESWGNQPGDYYAVDEPHLIHCMRHVKENWAAERDRVRIAGPQIRERFRPERVFEPLLQVVQSYLD